MVRNPVLWPALIAEWGLSSEWVRYFNEREGTRCGFCHSSLRDRHLALGIIEASRFIVDAEARSLKELCAHPKFWACSIAEINAAGTLHRFLRTVPNLAYSEFGGTSPGVRSEDLMALSYADGSFDLVITSETLEHVPDIHTAFREIRRVLKPNGWHVFSIPVVWDGRKTRQRASIKDGKIIHHLPPSYHGLPGRSAADHLVFYEFGNDVVDMCKDAGFELNLLRDPENPALVAFLGKKARDTCPPASV